MRRPASHPTVPVRPDRRHDVLVAGGGPAGATAAILLARAGLDVAVAERARFPRFHVGESLLPRNLPLLRELGVAGRLGEVPHHRKLGAEFAYGHEAGSLRFRFTEGLIDRDTETLNVERAAFDALLLDQARRAGATVFEETAVREILALGEDGAVVRLAGRAEGVVAARQLLDATGQSTLVGKHLGTREVYPDHRKVAFFGHLRGVERLPGDEAGHPCIVMMEDGWFWLIALDAERTSAGLVMDADRARRAGREHGVPPERMLAWGIARCPFVARRARDAVLPETNHVGADFSYRCRPYAGPGYFLLGDAATFLDPIFSTGICLAMVGAAEAARGVERILAGGDPVPVRSAYCRFVDAGTETFFRLVRRYYQPAFRDLMMEGEGPLSVHRALFSLLAGHVFPRPPWPLRWRLRLMELLTEVQARVPLVSRRPTVPLYEPADAPDAPDAAVEAGRLPSAEAAR